MHGTSVKIQNRSDLRHLYTEATHKDSTATRQLQTFLHDKVNPKVQVTGTLNAQTKTAYKQAYKNFQASWATDSFTPSRPPSHAAPMPNLSGGGGGAVGASSSGGGGGGGAVSSGSEGGGGSVSDSSSSADSSPSVDPSSYSSNYQPGGPINTPADFAVALCQALGVPATAANIASIVNWENKEGGNWHNSAHFNPLNTTLSMPGDSSMNSVGVKAYGSWAQGIQATADTLKNGGYGDIISALASGNGLGGGDLAGLSRWSGGGYSSI